MFCMSLLKKGNRDEFKADEAKYLDRYKLTSAQREAILKRQWNWMLELGGNIYFTAKLGATDGLSFQQVASIMTGRTQREYADMMLKGGRPAQGNRLLSGSTPSAISERTFATQSGWVDQCVCFGPTRAVFSACSSRESAIGHPRSMHRGAPGRPDPSQDESRL